MKVLFLLAFSVAATGAYKSGERELREADLELSQLHGFVEAFRGVGVAEYPTG
jgi:hypothetical protein